jgi:hypothetical protein
VIGIDEKTVCNDFNNAENSAPSTKRMPRSRQSRLAGIRRSGLAIQSFEGEAAA